MWSSRAFGLPISARAVQRFSIRSLATHTGFRPLSSQPVAVRVSEQERTINRLSWANLQQAVRALHRDGLVVLEDVVDHEKLDKLNNRMIQDALTLQAKGDAGPFNYNRGNIQQDPPLTAQYFEPQIFTNPLATQVIGSVIGPRSRMSFVSGNSALPPVDGSIPQSQPVHSDADFEHPSCPFAIVVNVPLVEMTPENGTTEVWLGTHTDAGLDQQEGLHGDRASGRIRHDLLNARTSHRPPSQPLVKKGSLVLRDLRLWHAGKPNYSSDVRVMLALIHFASWYRNPMTVEFSQELQQAVEQNDALQIQARFLPEGEILERYLDRPYGNAYDFNQKDRLVM